MSDYILARTIYGEARGEYTQTGPAALMAVAWVVRNRLQTPRRFGDSVESVCLKPYQFSCWNVKDPNRTLIESVTLKDPLFSLCHTLGMWVLQADALSDVIRGSDHYHGRGVVPYWTSGFKAKVILGRHTFYRLVGEQA